jgi:predicted metal-dependent hydrolase
MAKLSIKSKSITLAGQEIAYTLRTNSRARSLRLEIAPAGLVAVKPVWVSEQHLEDFIKEKSSWVLKKIAEKAAKTELNSDLEPFLPAEKKLFKLRAARLIIGRLEFFNQYYRFAYTRVTVREQKTRWGSCSRQGALNFNLRLYFIPEILLDYVVVHELCHLQEMNHGANFWRLVAETIPDYQLRRRLLKEQNL